MNSSYPSNIVLLVWMKTQPIMITMTPFRKSAINDFVMESSFLDSITKLFCTNFKTKSSSSTSANYGVESSIEYSRPKLFLVDSRLEFAAKLKFPIASLERCLLVEFQLFDWSLPKSNGPKILFNSVVPYFGSSMLTNGFL